MYQASESPGREIHTRAEEMDHFLVISGPQWNPEILAAMLTGAAAGILDLTLSAHNRHS